MGRGEEELQREEACGYWYVLPWVHDSNTSAAEYPLRIPVASKKPKGHWLSAENRREFFRQLAAEKGFDVNDSTWWKSVTKEDITSREVTNILNEALALTLLSR